MKICNVVAEPESRPWMLVEHLPSAPAVQSRDGLSALCLSFPIGEDLLGGLGVLSGASFGCALCLLA